MRHLRILVLFVGVVLIVGCVVSIHPLYTEKDLFYIPKLVGTWILADGKDTWVFEQSGKKAYELTITQGEIESGEPGEPAGFEAHLVRLGKFLFLDTYPTEPDIKNDYFTYHLIPGHVFWKIELNGDVLHIAYLDGEWLGDMIEQNKIKIAHERTEGELILTASTEELQKFILKYAEDTDAFPEPDEYHRMKKE